MIYPVLGTIRMRRTFGTGYEETFGNPRGEKPSVKPVHKLLEVELTPGAPAPVIGAVNEGLGIANDDIDPMKNLRGFWIPTEGDLMVGLMIPRRTGVHGGSVALPDPQIFDPPPQNLLDRRRVLTDFAVHVTNLTTHQPILHFRAPIIARFTMTGLLKGSRYLNMNPSGEVAVSPIGPRIHGMGLTHVVLALGLGWIVTAPEGQ